MKLALPKGRLLGDTADLLQRAGLGLLDYDEGSRSYRPKSTTFADLFLKVFQEKDIPIQVAIGNYDLGICGLDWVEELLVKYPSGDLVKVGDLGYGKSDLYAVASSYAGVSSVGEIEGGFETVRIVSEYQNLAESFALRLRLRRFKILPIWGAAEVYPPESADLAIIAETSLDRLAGHDLIPLARVLASRAFLIANRKSLAKADMSILLGHLSPSEVEIERESLCLPLSAEFSKKRLRAKKWFVLPCPMVTSNTPPWNSSKRRGLRSVAILRHWKLADLPWSLTVSPLR